MELSEVEALLKKQGIPYNEMYTEPEHDFYLAAGYVEPSYKAGESHIYFFLNENGDLSVGCITWPETAKSIQPYLQKAEEIYGAKKRTYTRNNHDCFEFEKNALYYTLQHLPGEKENIRLYVSTYPLDQKTPYAKDVFDNSKMDKLDLKGLTLRYKGNLATLSLGMTEQELRRALQPLGLTISKSMEDDGTFSIDTNDPTAPVGDGQVFYFNKSGNLQEILLEDDFSLPCGLQAFDSVEKMIQCYGVTPDRSGDDLEARYNYETTVDGITYYIRFLASTDPNDKKISDRLQMGFR